MELAGTAATLEDASIRVAESRPDILCLDIAAWGSAALQCMTRLLADRPLKVLVLSGSNPDGAALACEAIASGAIDFFVKPYNNHSFRFASSREAFLAKLLNMANMRLLNDRRSPGVQRKAFAPQERTVVVVGGAGGQRSLVTMFQCWPLNDRAKILVLQSVPEGYGAALVDKLAGTSGYPIIEAADGEPLVPGRALLVPSCRRMSLLDGSFIRLTNTNDSREPLADEVLKEFSSQFGHTLVAIFLSGAGGLGIEGAQVVRHAGGSVLIESEQSAMIPETILRLKAIDCFDGEADAADLPALSAEFGRGPERKAG
jgi:two-component system chemotaxis response regulator CheB